MVVKLEAPFAFSLNSTEATPEVASEALTEKVTLPVRVAFAAGFVIDAVGAVLSTTFVGRVDVDWLFAVSVTTARRS